MPNITTRIKNIKRHSRRALSELAKLLCECLHRAAAYCHDKLTDEVVSTMMTLLALWVMTIFVVYTINMISFLYKRVENYKDLLTMHGVRIGDIEVLLSKYKFAGPRK
jgi:hypothetical protein